MLRFGTTPAMIQLRRARLHGAGDALRARQRLERALSAIDPADHGLPPHALLIARRVAPATPWCAEQPRRAGSFRHAVGLELARASRTARRPWLHDDAFAAATVLFADEAELVACLIRDWLRGVMADRWWWRSVLERIGAEQWLRQRVLTRGEVLVPALSLLAPRGEMVPWIARLQESDARVAAAAVTRAFALFNWSTPADAFSAETPARDDSVAEALTGRGVSSTPVAAAAARVAETVPELRSPLLSREQRRLLALVGVTTRAPSWARTAQFAMAMAWLDRIEPGQDTIATALANPMEQPRLPSPLPPTDDSAALTETDASLSPSPLPPSDAGDVIVWQATQTPHAGLTRQAHLPNADARPTSPPQGAAAVAAQRPVMDAEISNQKAGAGAREIDAVAEPSTVPAESRAPAAQPEVPPLRELARATRIETRFGGIFYLLNAAIGMGLYGDFTAPRANNLALSPWDWLALIGRAWFGDRFVSDAVWIALADLAVRAPDDEPDRDFDRPDGWLDEHLGTLNARLRLALGAESIDLLAMVCCHRAQIEITPARVDVYLALCDLPLDLRIAGLDRDPGWIPAAGRSVAFHFE